MGPQLTVPSQSDFNNSYWAAMPPQIAALRNMQGEDRQTHARALAEDGMIIDWEIMGLNYDPWTAMTERLAANEPWFPNAIQTPLGQPGGYALPGVPVQGGQQPYPTTKPDGWITNSLKLADYPPYPKPPPPAPNYQLGPEIAPGVYKLLGGVYPGDKVHFWLDGSEYICRWQGLFGPVYAYVVTPAA